MRKWLLGVRGAMPVVVAVLLGCAAPVPSEPATPTVVVEPDPMPGPMPDPGPTPTPIPEPIPVPVPEPAPPPTPPIDGVLEIGSGPDRPTLNVQAFYDANDTGTRDRQEPPLGRAGLRLSPVRIGENGPEQTGPGRIVRADQNGNLRARLPKGLYRLEFVTILSPGPDKNAALWVTSEWVLELEADGSLDLDSDGKPDLKAGSTLGLPAFCQIATKRQPEPDGMCSPKYDLRPRAFLGINPTEITAGQTATLLYRTDDEATVRLDPFGTVETFRETDFFERVVTPETSTTYTLRAQNAYDTLEVSVRVTVNPAPINPVPTNP
jgi:hypothetical protein